MRRYRKELKMTKTQSKYWGIMEGSEGSTFTGTFVECWAKLVEWFGDKTLGELHQEDIKITRVK